jgi:hypothetical protein
MPALHAPNSLMHYGKNYYQKVYAGFENEEFAKKWALGCALVAGYTGQHFNAVLEFGAGFGQNLQIIDAAKKWAVDISLPSRRACEAKGFEWRDSLDAVPDRSFDLILSRHSLEHVTNPFEILSKLRSKAAPAATLYVTVPLDRSVAISSLDDFDEHKHLFAWSPESLKNLLLETGWMPQAISIHEGRLFRKMLPLLPRFKQCFYYGRRWISAVAPEKSAEIIVRAVPRSIDL